MGAAATLAQRPWARPNAAMVEVGKGGGRTAVWSPAPTTAPGAAIAAPSPPEAGAGGGAGSVLDGAGSVFIMLLILLTPLLLAHLHKERRLHKERLSARASSGEDREPLTLEDDEPAPETAPEGRADEETPSPPPPRTSTSSFEDFLEVELEDGLVVRGNKNMLGVSDAMLRRGESEEEPTWLKDAAATLAAAPPNRKV